MRPASHIIEVSRFKTYSLPYSTSKMSYPPYNMYDMSRRRRVPMQYMSNIPDNMYGSSDPLQMDNYPNIPRRGGNLNICKDRFGMCLNVEDYKPEELRVKTTEGFIIIEGKHEEQSDEFGLIQRHFYRRCPLPQGFKAQGLLYLYSAVRTLYITTKLVKINGDDSAVATGLIGDEERPVSGKTDQAVQVEMMEVGGSRLAKQTVEEVKDIPSDQPPSSGQGETSVQKEPMLNEKSEN